MAVMVNINSSAINQAIGKLQRLKTACDAVNTDYPPIVGGGQSVNELEQIALLYKSINTQLSFISADQTAANKIKSK